jgi:hypothetical protein
MQSWLGLLVAGSTALLLAVPPPRPPGSANSASLRVGEAATAPVLARPRWNFTGVRLVRGGEYLITGEGTWKDAGYEHGPDGGTSPNLYMKMWEWLRRMRHENWFELICAVDSRKSTAFPVGSSRQIVAPADGELTCFANDVWLMYWNNSGEIRITVKRTR